MFRVEKEVVMRATPEKIWSVLEDTEGMPNWLPKPRGFAKVVKASHLSGPKGVGGMRECTTESGGTLVERYTEWEPPRRLAYTIERDTMGVRKRMKRFDAYVGLSPGPDGTTRVAYGATFEMKGVLGRVLMGPVLRRVLGGLYRGSLENIRDLVQTAR